MIVSDTAGRAWRVGQTDIAIGCAGLIPFDSFAGRTDPYGNPLAVTSPAIADEIAGASGKFGKRPIVIARGTEPAWHTTDDGLGLRGLSFERSDIIVTDGTIILTVSNGDEVGTGVLAQRLVSLVSLGIVHGESIGVRIKSTND